jgi:hypothetical protein
MSKKGLEKTFKGSKSYGKIGGWVVQKQPKTGWMSLIDVFLDSDR